MNRETLCLDLNERLITGHCTLALWTPRLIMEDLSHTLTTVVSMHSILTR